MKILKYSIFTIILVCLGTLNTISEYKNVKEGLQAISSAHVTAFSVDNLLSSGMPQEGERNWKGALNGVEAWINKLLAKERPLGSRISEENRNIIKQAVGEIRAASNDLIGTIEKLRANNFDFEESRYADINLDKVKAEVAALLKRSNGLKNLQKSLTPGFLDIQDTRDIKKLLKDIAYYLQVTFEKVGKDLDKLRAPIRYAIDRKKYGNSNT